MSQEYLPWLNDWFVIKTFVICIDLVNLLTTALRYSMIKWLVFHQNICDLHSLSELIRNAYQSKTVFRFHQFIFTNIKPMKSKYCFRL